MAEYTIMIFSKNANKGDRKLFCEAVSALELHAGHKLVDSNGTVYTVETTEINDHNFVTVVHLATPLSVDMPTGTAFTKE